MKSIINATANKKRDTMPIIAFSDDDIPAPGSPGAAYNMTGDTSYEFLFSPTARTLDTQPRINMRNKTVTYARGYRESCETISDFTGTAITGNWTWRRIVFSTKDAFYESFPDSTVQYYDGSTVGYCRPAWNLLGIGTQTGTARNALEDMLFEGSVLVDWYSRLSAKVNTKRVTLHYDKVLQLTSGNNQPRIHRNKFWHGFNKPLVYRDHESGPSQAVDAFSTEGKPGIGNVFIWDYFENASENPDQRLQWQPLGTYYWHEK